MQLRIVRPLISTRSAASPTLLIGAVIAMFATGALAQEQLQTNAGSATNSDPAAVTLTVIGGNTRRYQHVVPVSTNRQGKVTYRAYGGYTEIASGLNHLVSNNWVASSENIDITADGGAATNGQHTVHFNANINTSGAIDLGMPDGTHLKSHILGLGYYDSSIHGTVLIALPQDSLGYVVNGNQVVYSNAFNGVKANLRYTYTLGGFEQDLILLEQPPFPTNYGMNPATTRLQLWTEFDNSTTPQITETANGDQYLNFGAMQMGSGRAFIMGDEADAAPVRKQWVMGGGGLPALLEEVQLSAVADQLDSLPPSAANTNRSARNQFEGFPKQWPPPPKMAQKGMGGLKLASAKTPTQGFVMDYYAVTSTSNFTFQGDTTYYVSSGVTLSGTTTIEGGAVIKYADTNISKITLNGPLSCQTGPYRPAVFTGVYDNSVGESLYGGTNVPKNTNGLTYLVGGGLQTNDYKYLRFMYAGTAISNANPATVWHSQFVSCGTGVNAGASNITLRNVLMTVGTNCVSTTGALSAENLTADQFVNLSGSTPGSVCLTNSILTAVTNQPGGMTLTATVTSGSGLYQTVGGGNYYLAALSPNRDAGSTGINTNLAGDLKKKTTFPPILLNSTFASNTVLNPQAQRDVDATDLGFHYDVLDYVWSNLTVNSGVTLTLTNGVAVGMWGATGLTANGSIVSQGTPVYLDKFLGCCMAQEQRLTEMTTIIGGVATWQSLYLRFTDLPTLGGAVTYLQVYDDSYVGDIDPVILGPLTLQDCQLLGGQMSILLYNSSIALTLQNNLVERVSISINRSFDSLESNPPELAVNAYNNLFHDGTLNLSYSICLSDDGYNNPVWLWYDNLFEGVSLNETLLDYGYLYASNYVHSGFNGYVNSTTFADSTPGNEDVDPPIPSTYDKFPASADYQKGPLGIYYYPTSGNLSCLINAGSTTADQLGLYHYTVRTDEAVDGFSTVSIGFHYVAVDGNGNPLDTDGDGIPDYLEDANGNGVVDSGETNWKDPNDLGLKVLITRPKNGSIIP